MLMGSIFPHVTLTLGWWIPPHKDKFISKSQSMQIWWRYFLLVRTNSSLTHPLNFWSCHNRRYYKQIGIWVLVSYFDKSYYAYFCFTCTIFIRQDNSGSLGHCVSGSLHIGSQNVSTLLILPIILFFSGHAFRKKRILWSLM